MQEDVENRTINFAISTTKLTGRTILAAARKFLQWRAGKVHGKPVGKQSVKQLLRQDQGATNIEIEKTGIRDFKRILDKYGVDYAITKNHDDPPPVSGFLQGTGCRYPDRRLQGLLRQAGPEREAPQCSGAPATVQGPGCRAGTWPDEREETGACRTMNQNTKRLVLLNLPYVLMGPLCYQSGLCLAAGCRG